MSVTQAGRFSGMPLDEVTWPVPTRRRTGAGARQIMRREAKVIERVVRSAHFPVRCLSRSNGLETIKSA
jgi:hypothetical protein